MDSEPQTFGLGRFVSELRRRHVVRVAVAYSAVGFVLLQTAEIVFPAFLPGFEADAALRVVVVAFLLLFPVVVALAWVYEITPQGIRAMESIDAESGRPPGGHLLPRLALLVFTVLIAGSAGLWWYRTDAAALDAAEARRSERRTPFVAASTTDPTGPIRSLAVLPLEDFSPDGGENQAYFAAGMHEALISQLSQLGTVRVISRTSTEGYERAGKSLPQVGADLGVDAVVEGSVVRADGRVRITIQLIHAASDTHLLARDYERDFDDILSLQREVATAIASEIDTRIQEGEAGSTPAVPVREPTATAEVQEAVMRGRFALRRGDGATEAERYFEGALVLDSTFVPALTGIAGAHLLRGLGGEGSSALHELVAARTFALRAVRHDTTSIEAREVLASTEEALSDYGARIAAGAAETAAEAVAETAQVRVVQLSADSVMFITDSDTTRVRRSEAPTTSATEMGRLISVAMANDVERERSAGDEIRSVLRLQMGGRPESALRRAREALERFPESGLLWDIAERLSVTNGDLAETVALRRARPASSVGDGPGPDALARDIERDGVLGYWSWKLEELEAREADGASVSPVDRAAALSALGRTDEALDLLYVAREARDMRLMSLRSDPVWDPLRPEARFKALLRSLEPHSRPPGSGGLNRVP